MDSWRAQDEGPAWRSKFSKSPVSPLSRTARVVHSHLSYETTTAAIDDTQGCMTGRGSARPPFHQPLVAKLRECLAQHRPCPVEPPIRVSR